MSKPLSLNTYPFREIEMKGSSSLIGSESVPSGRGKLTLTKETLNTSAYVPQLESDKCANVPRFVIRV